MSDAIAKRGLSADCTLPGGVALAIAMGGEHPCDRCNMDRKVCRGEPRKEDYSGYIDNKRGTRR